MARTRWIPEAEKPEPRYGKGDPDARDEGDDLGEPAEEPTPWEFESLGNFLEYLLDEERDWYTTEELVGLAAGTQNNNRTLRVYLETQGLSLRGREPEKAFRTFGDNPHDRWHGKGSCNTHGGGGGDSLVGMVGRVG